MLWLRLTHRKLIVEQVSFNFFLLGLRLLAHHLLRPPVDLLLLSLWHLGCAAHTCEVKTLVRLLLIGLRLGKLLVLRGLWLNWVGIETDRDLPEVT